MHLVILALVIYAVFAEWRISVLKKRADGLERNLSKLKKDKTIWYSGVLPKAGDLCLFQENSGEYVISKLSDKRWQKKDGSVDFGKIKRWVAIKDLENI